MGFDIETEMFIERVCKYLYMVSDYTEFIKELTDAVDEYGIERGFDLDMLDKIENYILLKLGR